MNNKLIIVSLKIQYFYGVFNFRLEFHVQRNINFEHESLVISVEFMAKIKYKYKNYKI